MPPRSHRRVGGAIIDGAIAVVVAPVTQLGARRVAGRVTVVAVAAVGAVALGRVARRDAHSIGSIPVTVAVKVPGRAVSRSDVIDGAAARCAWVLQKAAAVPFYA